MLSVVTAAEMRALDAETIADIGLPGAVLMENAGRAVAREILELVVGVDRARVAVIAGAGNNGGDGHVVARVLREHGADPTVYLAVSRDRVGGDAALHLGAYEKSGGLVVSLDRPDDLAAHRDAITGAHVVVDALFGTGLSRPIEGHLAAVIELLGEARGQVVSVDVPSGLDADSGAILGVAAAPKLTVTMAFLKAALAIAPGFSRAGRVVVAEIGIPTGLAFERGARLGLLEIGDVAALVPRPSPATHKGRRGHAFVVAGWPGKRGAGRLSAVAALRAGAGLATLAASAADGAAADPVMTASVAGPDELTALAAGKAAIAIGPGLDTGAAGQALVRRCLELDLPLVLDADALNHLAGDLGAVARAERAVLTPHPGEAARLLGSTVAAVEADRVAAVRELAARSRAVVVLKGARTLICDGRGGGGFVAINPTGGPALATAGTGDVLTGVIAGLLAQGLRPVDAAWVAVWIHGRAGEAAAQRHGDLGVIATDLLDHLPRALAALTGDAPKF